jgi:hypothetical protein
VGQGTGGASPQALIFLSTLCSTELFYGTFPLVPVWLGCKLVEHAVWVVQRRVDLTRLREHRRVYRKAGGAVNGVEALHRIPTELTGSKSEASRSLALQTTKKNWPSR